MPKIKVEQPFSVRLEGEPELLAYAAGVHEVDADVLKHWFVQACIKDGRAVLLGDAVQATPEVTTEPEPDVIPEVKEQKKPRRK